MASPTSVVRLVPAVLLAAAIAVGCGGQPPLASAAASAASPLDAALPSTPTPSIDGAASPITSSIGESIAASTSPQASTSAAPASPVAPTTVAPVTARPTSGMSAGSTAELDALLQQVDSALGSAGGALSQATTDLNTKGE